MSELVLGNLVDIYYDMYIGEVIIVDGYINKCIIGFDINSNEFLRLWGVYGIVLGGGICDGDFDVL